MPDKTANTDDIGLIVRHSLTYKIVAINVS
jgi:hypothetical protein